MTTPLEASPTGGAPDEWLPTLRIRTYNRLEAVARRRASYPAIRCFAPVAFAAVGFPTRVSHDAELRRYADIMWEVADRDHWLKQQRWSATERNLILGLRAEVVALTQRLFDRPVQPFMCLFPPMPIVRLIESVADRLGRRLRVMEIGPGSGALGGYCLLLGHNYTAVEITQSLYLWQHRLFRWIARGDFQDLAESEGLASGLSDVRGMMIPWWHFARMFNTPSLRGVDVIVCDAAMGEMDPFAHRYLVHLAKQLLEQSEAGLFLFQQIGEQRFSNDSLVAHRFAAHGFRPFACGPVRVQAASPRSPVRLLQQLEKGAPPFESGATSGSLQPAAEFLTVDPATLMESYAFFDFLRLDLG